MSSALQEEAEQETDYIPKTDSVSDPVRWTRNPVGESREKV